MFRRVLVGFDGSPDAAHALRVALDLGAELDAEVVALSVCRPPAHVETIEEREDELEAEARRLRDAIGSCRSLAEGTGVHFSHTVLEAAGPAEALASYVIEHGFDLLVLGSHGTDYASHGGIGRVVDRLLHDQPCPMLVVERR